MTAGELSSRLDYLIDTNNEGGEGRDLEVRARVRVDVGNGHFDVPVEAAHVVDGRVLLSLAGEAMRQVASVIKDGKVQYFLADTEEGELTEFATIAVSAEFDPVTAVKLGFNLIAAVGLNGHKHEAPPARSVGATIEAAAAPLPVTAASSSRQWKGTKSAIEYVGWRPGCRIPEVAKHFRISTKAAASAITRGAASGDIIRRDGALYPRPTGGGILAATPTPVKAGGPITKKGTARQRARGERKVWDVTIEQVVDYIRRHPWCSIEELATTLLGSPVKEHRQVISNRIMGISARVGRGELERLDKRSVPNPAGGTDLVEYRFIESVDVTNPILVTERPSAYLNEPGDDATLDLREPGLD